MPPGEDARAWRDYARALDRLRDYVRDHDDCNRDVMGNHCDCGLDAALAAANVLRPTAVRWPRPDSRGGDHA